MPYGRVNIKYYLKNL